MGLLSRALLHTLQLQGLIPWESASACKHLPVNKPINQTHPVS